MQKIDAKEVFAMTLLTLMVTAILLAGLIEYFGGQI